METRPPHPFLSTTLKGSGLYSVVSLLRLGCFKGTVSPTLRSHASAPRLVSAYVFVFSFRSASWSLISPSLSASSRTSGNFVRIGLEKQQLGWRFTGGAVRRCSIGFQISHQFMSPIFYLCLSNFHAFQHGSVLPFHLTLACAHNGVTK